MYAYLYFKPGLGPGYTDTFSNRSVFISLRFQIDPLWIAYSNVCVFVIVLIVFVYTGGETATISLRFQVKTYPRKRAALVFKIILPTVHFKMKRVTFFDSTDEVPSNRRFVWSILFGICLR